MIGRGLRSLLAVAAGALFLMASAAQAAPLEIEVLSTRADLVSGSQVLTAIALPRGANPSKVKVTLNGRNVTREFAMRANHQFAALLGPLRLGRNSVIASLRRRGRPARATIIDHPRSGPVFSGPQVKPWMCNPGAKDAGCDVAPTYTYEYEPAGTSSGSTCTISRRARRSIRRIRAPGSRQVSRSRTTL
jgi:hypothetical protein